MVSVYRAPMRSRGDGVDAGETIQRARRLGLCGFGQLARDPAEADRLARRVARFAAIEDGSFVWTRDPNGLYWLGRVCGPYFYDDDASAASVDLVHVRRCDWLTEPRMEPRVPAAVTATFGRGGRNFQQTHDASVGRETQQIWDAGTPR